MTTPAANDRMAPVCEPVAPIFLRYRDSLLRFIRSKVDDPVSQEDLLSDVMVKIYDQCEKLEDIKNVEAWLIVVARNTVYDYFRTQMRNHSLATTDLLVTLDEEIADQVDIRSCVHAMIALLPEKYRGPLHDYEIQGITQKQLAKQYKLSESGLKSRVQRGRVMLKELFAQHCSEAILERCQEDSCVQKDCHGTSAVEK